MEMVDEFEIEFSRPDKPVYYGGETLEGDVLLETDKEIRLEEIELILEGRSEVKLRNQSSKPFVKRIFRERSLIFTEYTLKTGQCVIPRGNHSHHFRFLLPDDLPGSFEAERGTTIFTVECLLHYRKGKEGESANRTFIVVENVDLNLVVKNQPTSEETSLTISRGLCCGAQKVDIQLSLNRSGFIPGERIVITGEIANFSGSVIHKAFINLLQLIQYYGEGHIGEWKREICRGGSELILEEGAVKQVEEEMTIPDTGSSTQSQEDIISINYILQLNLHPLKPVLKIPITIGSKPLIETPSTRLPKYQRFADDVPEIHVPNRFAELSIKSCSEPRAGKRTGGLGSYKSTMIVRAR